MTKLYWGICGTGRICNDFTAALKTLPVDNHEVTAVAGRFWDKAVNFAEKFNIPDFYQGYEHLATHKSVNIVYIGILNNDHYALAKLMLQHGKHVMVEKPMCMCIEDTVSLINFAKEKKLFLMEAMWSRCFPGYDELRQKLDGNIIGEVRQVTANLGFNISSVDRVSKAALGGGAMYDLGVYVLQFALLVYKDEHPIDIKVIGEHNAEGVDLSAGILLQYSNGRSALLSVNTKVEMSNMAEIMGSDGYIMIPKFWCPIEFYYPSGCKVYSLPETKHPLEYFRSTGLSYEAEEARICITDGKCESPKMTWNDSIKLAKLRDEIIQKLHEYRNIITKV